jgi:cell division septation protein DedD
VNRHYDSDNDLQDLQESGGRDREISLGTATILGIFLVLALLCAVFFGFGYSMGRRSAQTIVSAPETSPVADSDSTDSKPAPGSPINPSAAGSAAHKAIADRNDAATSVADSTASSATTAANVSPSGSVTSNTRYDSTPQPQATSIKPVSMPRPAAATTAIPAAVPVPGLGSIVVQVAAVSHQEDAEVLTNALKKRGYSVAVRQVPQDKLLHVQIGPFANRKDADAMRQRLLADGYNAIVK